VEITIRVITNNDYNNNNNKVITIKGRGGWDKTLIKTLQKLIKTA